jgi:hypothetical protein
MGVNSTYTEVVAAIQSELDYQVLRWNPSTTITGGIHDVNDYTVFLDAYLRKAKDAMSFQGEPGASTEALNIVRKLTALCATCIIQNSNMTLSNLYDKLSEPEPITISEFLLTADVFLFGAKSGVVEGIDGAPLECIEILFELGVDTMIYNGAIPREIPDSLRAS